MAKNKSTKNATIEAKQDRDELVSELADILNKDSKEGKKVYFLDDQEDPSTTIVTGKQIGRAHV